MRYQQLIEGLSDILYHKTSLENLMKIMQDDVFRLTPDFGPGPDQKFRKKDKAYYMSFARSKLGEFKIPGQDSMGLVSVVVDGRALSLAGYSGAPVDYWETTFSKRNNSHYTYSQDEMEDRLYSTEQFIPAATKYIKEIHVMFSDARSKKTAVNNNILALRRLEELCKQHNIPLYIYKDYKHFRFQDKRHTIKVSDLIKNDSSEVTDWWVSKQEPLNKDLVPWLELLNADSKEDLSKEAGEIQYAIIPDNPRSADYGLGTTISNTRLRGGADEFLLKMRQLRLKDTVEVIKYIRKKFS